MNKNKFMDLKNFISKTITGIINGLDDVSSKLKNKKVGMYSMGKDNRRHIEFDVAVAVENKKGKSGGANINVLQVFGGGGKITSESINSTVSRIKFGVRISDIKP